jgi:hypothetical protein
VIPWECDDSENISTIKFIDIGSRTSDKTKQKEISIVRSSVLCGMKSENIGSKKV